MERLLYHRSATGGLAVSRQVVRSIDKKQFAVAKLELVSVEVGRFVMQSKIIEVSKSRLPTTCDAAVLRGTK